MIAMWVFTSESRTSTSSFNSSMIQYAGCARIKPCTIIGTTFQANNSADNGADHQEPKSDDQDSYPNEHCREKYLAT